MTFNSSVVSSAFVSATELQAAIPASAIAVAGTPFVTVANPNGPPSVVATFTVNNPVPGASSISPSSLPAGNPAATLSVTGTNFNTSSTVLVNGASRTTTFVNSTSLNAALLASDLAHSGTLNISVKNPAPGGGTTSALTFIVEDFSLNLQTPAPPVTAGQPANFSLMIVPANTTTSSAVTFTASGVPANAMATFSPSGTIPGGKWNDDRDDDGYDHRALGCGSGRASTRSAADLAVTGVGRTCDFVDGAEPANGQEMHATSRSSISSRRFAGHRCRFDFLRREQWINGND